MVAQDEERPGEGIWLEGSRRGEEGPHKMKKELTDEEELELRVRQFVGRRWWRTEAGRVRRRGS